MGSPMRRACYSGHSATVDFILNTLGKRKWGDFLCILVVVVAVVIF